jgi:hypothetical protein
VRAAAAALVGTVAGLAALAFPRYGGTLGPWLAFHAASAALLLLVLPRPRSYAYAFLAALLFLGLWCKLLVHLLLGGQFIEPTGGFDGSGGSWDAALGAAAAGLLGVAGARAAWLGVARGAGEPVPLAPPAPRWYLRARGPLWVGTLVGVLGLNLWNLEASFYQIGVNPRVVLPLHLNVPLAWGVNWGGAIAVACLAGWELRARPRSGAGVLLGSIVEAIASGISALSRSVYLFHTVPVLLGWIETRRPRAGASGKRALLGGALIVLAGLAVSLLVVQGLRSVRYFAPVAAAPQAAFAGTPPAEAAGTPASERGSAPGYYAQMLQQLPFLLVHRWVGLEGVLSVSAYPAKEPALLLAALREDPRRGVQGLYQRIAGAAYGESAHFTFLTLAGPVALLLYSGSVTVVAVGMALLTGVVLGTEALARHGTRNPLVVALAAIAMAYTVSQVTFPYLLAVFFAQLWVTLGAVALVERLGSRG